MTTAKPRWGLQGSLSDPETFYAHPTSEGLLYAQDQEDFIMRVGALHAAGVIDQWLAYLLVRDFDVTIYDRLVEGAGQ